MNDKVQKKWSSIYIRKIEKPRESGHECYRDWKTGMCWWKKKKFAHYFHSIVTFFSIKLCGEDIHILAYIKLHLNVIILVKENGLYNVQSNQV